MSVKVLKFIVGTILFFLTQVSYSATEKLVLIGGLDERVIWSCGETPCKDHTYLTDWGKLGRALKDLEGVVKYDDFPWSGDPVTHNEGGENLKKKGFYNDAPNLLSLDKNGDIIHTVDFRSIYASILDKWLEVDEVSILNKTFRKLDFI